MIDAGFNLINFNSQFQFISSINQTEDIQFIELTEIEIEMELN